MSILLYSTQILLHLESLNTHISQGEKEAFTVFVSYVNVRVIASVNGSSEQTFPWILACSNASLIRLSIRSKDILKSSCQILILRSQ